MQHLFVFLISFTFIFLFFITNLFIKKIRGTLGFSKDITMIINRYKLDKKKFNYEKISFVMALINSFIVAVVGTIASAINLDMVWQLVIAFVLLMILMYIMYTGVGRYLRRKENKK